MKGAMLYKRVGCKKWYVLKCMCIEKFSCKKNTLILKELFKLFILTLYNFSIYYFVLEILRFV